MSQTTSNPAAGPALAESVEEVQGIFPSDVALQNAIAALTTSGFNRAELSLPDAAPAPSINTPNQGAEDPNTDEDARQTRTLQTSMAGSAGALLAAGMVVMTTGGAAVPAAIGAAILGGLGAGALGSIAGKAANQAEHDLREEAAAKGELVLAVHLKSADQLAVVQQAMEQAGATRIARVIRRAPGAVDSAGWTGA